MQTYTFLLSFLICRCIFKPLYSEYLGWFSDEFCQKPSPECCHCYLSFRFSLLCLLSEDGRDDTSNDHCGCSYSECYQTKCDHILSSCFILFIVVVCSYENILIIHGRLMITSPTTKNPIQSPANIFFLLSFKFFIVGVILLSEDRREDTSHDHWCCGYTEHYITKCDDHSFFSFHSSLVIVSVVYYPKIVEMMPPTIIDVVVTPSIT